jgi:RNA polymerase sigma factor (TIGR02999 family)
MNEVTQMLHAAAQGDSSAASQLLPLVHDELRQLAARKLVHEAAGQTLEPTALVHEAYLRLVGDEHDAQWEGRGHFFAAAAEAMRRILIENARRKKREKHGGGLRRVELPDLPVADQEPDDLLALDDALARFAAEDPAAAEVVKLRLYAGLSVEEAADRLLPLPLQFHDELAEVLPLPQRIKIGIFLQLHHILEAFARRIAQEPHGRVAVELRCGFALLIV